MSKRIGVIAGTPIDTMLGVNFVKQNGLRAVGLSTASDPQEQNRLQYLNPDELTNKVSFIIKKLEGQGVFKTMIYCNSLSAAIDIDLINRLNPNTSLVTPLDVYKRFSINVKSLVIWAANGQCLENIEKIFYKHNPLIQIIGVSLLPVVKAIEELRPPDRIIKDFSLHKLCPKSSEPSALLLGCTHFPYLKEELKHYLSIPIIDPAENMLNELLR
ncbi:MAG: Asp/Glu racemase [Tepidanaerobacteraceae bacterium]|jgi:glutamate racemase